MQQEWEAALRAGQLRIPRCTGCKRWNWYPLPVCRSCGCGDFVWEALLLEGSLHSWTRVHRNFSNYPIEPIPYVVGLVEPTGAPGVRIACRYDGPDHQVVRPVIGERVILGTASGAPAPYVVFSRQDGGASLRKSSG